MIVSLDRLPLQGAAADRFRALAKALTKTHQRNHEGDRRALLDEDLAWARTHLDPDSNTIAAYEAAARVLVDLVRLGWQVREEGYGMNQRFVNWGNASKIQHPVPGRNRLRVWSQMVVNFMPACSMLIVMLTGAMIHWQSPFVLICSGSQPTRQTRSLDIH